MDSKSDKKETQPSIETQKIVSGGARNHWSLAGGAWNISWPQRVSQHDLVYLSPPDDPMQGLPIGNGDLGALVWVEGSRVHLAINKVDTWDDGPDANFHNWASAEEEHQTTLRGCARLTLDFGLPFWDVQYLKDFHGRLRLADATVALRANSPFGQSEVRAYVSQKHRTLVVRAETTASEAIRQWATLARFGSRAFAHWYAKVNRDASIGLSGTQTQVENGRIIIRQQLRTLRFVVAMALAPDAGSCSSAELLHSRAAQYELSAALRLGYTIYVTVVTSENASDPEAEARERLDAAIADGEAAIAVRQADDWKEFWCRALVQLPDSYLANIWHLTLYFANSSSRGASPPHFCRGLWGWNHDFLPWCFYFHWNMQWYVWQLHPADAGELAEPYLRYRFEQLPKAIAYAREVHQCAGAFYADVAERRGYQDLTPNEIHTPGPQIAMDFWRHYQFTGDHDFLRERAYPVMRAVAEWYLSTIRLDDDGRYHPMPGNVYESTVTMEDPITDLVMIRSLFPVVAEAAEILNATDVDRKRLLQIVDRLVEQPFAELRPDEQCEKDGKTVHSCGLGAGKPVLSPKVLVAGFDPKTKQWMRNRIAGQDGGYYGIPDAELAPVFPSGVVGLKDRGSELFAALVTQVRLHPIGADSMRKERSPSMASGADGLCFGWCSVPIVCARLGLKEESVAMMRDHVALWQLYPQGFGHYGPYSINQRDKNQYYHTHQVRDASAPEQSEQTSPFAGWNFRHFSNEAMPIVAAAINEMLLQSHEGIIRLCPAVPDDWEVAFTLLARGGFKVSAQRQGGGISWVWIESRLGNKVSLENPWPEAARIFVWEDQKLTRTLTIEHGAPIAFETRRGGSYLLGCDSNLVNDWKETALEVSTNEQPRKLGLAMLGKERQF